MIPWLLVAELISLAGKPLSQLVSERQQAYPCSGEINFNVADVKACIHAVKNYYANQNPTIDETDGVSMSFGNWRMNIRGSNTEPLLRLNIETKADSALVQQQLQAITALLQQTA
jgi:phosphomannomutase